jgi:ankyrin repeat protein
LQPLPVNPETRINVDPKTRIDVDPTKSDLWWADGIATLSSETIAQKLQQGAEIDSINPDWYGWEALHYAARTTEPDKLKVICDKLPRDKINTLTMLSENALHILLDHGVLGQSFNITCQNGTDLKTSKIINQEEERIVKCAEILIDAGIDVNHNNFWNDTPLLIAIKRKYFTIVKMLLEKDDIDLDSCRGTVSGKSARELLRGRKKIRKLKTKALPKQPSTHTKILFRLLKSGDEEAFLKYNGGKIRDILKTNENIDGDGVSNSSCTLLQYCFRRGLIAWHQEQARCESDSPLYYQDTTANRLVQIFCQNGMVKCIQHLLDNGADIDFTLRKFEDGKTLLQAAIVKGYYPLIAVILGRTQITFDPNTLCPAIVELLESTTDDIDLNCTLSIVLNRLLTSETPLDEKGIVILNQIWKLESGLTRFNKENVLLLLKFSGSLNRSSDIAQSRFLCWWNSDITNKALEKIGPEVIQKHLDECVEQQEDKVCINYDSFINNGSVEQVLRTFVSSPVLNVCLNHFVFKILIMQKWEKLRFMKIKYFYLNLLCYVIFYLLLNVYILCKFNKVSNPAVDFVYGLGWIFLLLFVVKELFQLLTSAGSYFSQFNNYAELLFTVTTFLVYSVDANWVDIAEVLSILSCNLVLLLLLEQMPQFAKYIIILRTVVFYLMYIVFYFIQFVAFAICFYILFANSEQAFWTDLGNKIFETIILFTGNLDYMGTPWRRESSSNGTSQDSFHNFSNKELFSKLILLLFVLFMTIILHNLLLGLLVTDMENLNKRVKLFEQLKRASFVVRFEKFLDSAYLRYLPNCILDRFHSGRDLFKDNKYVVVNINDKKMIDDDGKEQLNFILPKKEKPQDSLKKLYRYITAKVNEQSHEGNRHHVNSAVLEKLELVEERLKNLHEITEVMKVGLHKNR